MSDIDREAGEGAPPAGVAGATPSVSTVAEGARDQDTDSGPPGSADIDTVSTTGAVVPSAVEDGSSGAGYSMQSGRSSPPAAEPRDDSLVKGKQDSPYSPVYSPDPAVVPSALPPAAQELSAAGGSMEAPASGADIPPAAEPCWTNDSLLTAHVKDEQDSPDSPVYSPDPAVVPSALPPAAQELSAAGGSMEAPASGAVSLPATEYVDDSHVKDEQDSQKPPPDAGRHPGPFPKQPLSVKEMTNRPDFTFHLSVSFCEHTLRYVAQYLSHHPRGPLEAEIKFFRYGAWTLDRTWWDTPLSKFGLAKDSTLLYLYKEAPAPAPAATPAATEPSAAPAPEPAAAPSGAPESSAVSEADPGDESWQADGSCGEGEEGSNTSPRKATGERLQPPPAEQHQREGLRSETFIIDDKGGTETSFQSITTQEGVIDLAYSGYAVDFSKTPALPADLLAVEAPNEAAVGTEEVAKPKVATSAAEVAPKAGDAAAEKGGGEGRGGGGEGGGDEGGGGEQLLYVKVTQARRSRDTFQLNVNFSTHTLADVAWRLSQMPEGPLEAEIDTFIFCGRNLERTCWAQPLGTFNVTKLSNTLWYVPKKSSGGGGGAAGSPEPAVASPAGEPSTLPPAAPEPSAAGGSPMEVVQDNKSESEADMMDSNAPASGAVFFARQARGDSLVKGEQDSQKPPLEPAVEPSALPPAAQEPSAAGGSPMEVVQDEKSESEADIPPAAQPVVSSDVKGEKHSQKPRTDGKRPAPEDVQQQPPAKKPVGGDKGKKVVAFDQKTEEEESLARHDLKEKFKEANKEIYVASSGNAKQILSQLATAKMGQTVVLGTKPPDGDGSDAPAWLSTWCKPLWGYAVTCALHIRTHALFLYFTSLLAGAGKSVLKGWGACQPSWTRCIRLSS